MKEAKRSCVDLPCSEKFTITVQFYFRIDYARFKLEPSPFQNTKRHDLTFGLNQKDERHLFFQIGQTVVQWKM